MTKKNRIDTFKSEIQKAVLAYEKGEFIDIKTETTKLVSLATNYSNEIDGSHLKLVAKAISELIPQWVEKGNATTWSAVDYLIEKLELDKAINNDFSIISDTLEFFIGNRKPTDSKARFFLLEAFIHSGGKLQQRTILNEEAYFKKDNPSFWLGLVIDAYPAEYIKERIKEYITKGYIDIDELIPLIPEIYDKQPKEFPSIMVSFIDAFRDQESKNDLNDLFESFMGEFPEEYQTKIQNSKLKQSPLTNNPAYGRFRKNLNFLTPNMSEQFAVTD